MFLRGADLEDVSTLLLLPCVVVIRAALLWLREISAQRGAVRVKSKLREKLFAHILRLGPAYTRASAPASSQRPRPRA